MLTMTNHEQRKRSVSFLRYFDFKNRRNLGDDHVKGSTAGKSGDQLIGQNDGNGAHLKYSHDHLKQSDQYAKCGQQFDLGASEMIRVKVARRLSHRKVSLESAICEHIIVNVHVVIFAHDLRQHHIQHGHGACAGCNRWQEREDRNRGNGREIGRIGIVDRVVVGG